MPSEPPVLPSRLGGNVADGEAGQHAGTGPEALFSLRNRLALVTGSSRGIGLVLAAGLARHGAAVVLNGRHRPTLEEAAGTLEGAGARVHVRPFDVADPDAAEAGIAAVEREIGPLDILVNNAGLQHRAPLENFPAAEWERLRRTNLDSVLFMGQAAARRMIGRGRGKIINIASVQSELARPNIAPYGATKGAVKMLTRGMATEWARHGLQVNAIAPGYFATELNRALVEDAEFTAWLARRTPAGRWGRTEELVGAAVFLASDASSFVNGHLLAVDGGITACL
ncbi:glucose 1-dehydrogenase [Rhizosaccharibacter radicis]|uniref:Glucose 1-dehydrogenase n=1 Tax=Rhizosaccharibacter radicis TaxID=2782605 RepID=A0ABT1VYW2_9PROT|nr:glucose 1-dehydrogenase [Acetobacteraceae bacterium KSS12]